MAKSEYVKLIGPEINYGEKYLLQSQLGLAVLLQRVKTYHKLRKDELLLKIALKAKLEEASDSLRILEKILPKTEDEKPKHERKLTDKKPSLEEEIKLIKQRLGKLQ